MSISLNGSLTNEDLIRDECELESYLEEVEQQRKCMLSTNVDQPSNLLSSFWSHPAVRRPGEVSPLLRRCAYQLAPTIGKTESYFCFESYLILRIFYYVYLLNILYYIILIVIIFVLFR